MPLLSFDEIRAKAHATDEFCDVTLLSEPFAGSSIRIGKLGAEQKISLGIRYQGYERNADGTRLKNPEDIAEFQILLVAAAARDEQGNSLFVGREGRTALNCIDHNDIVLLANQASRLNGMDRDDAVEDAKKNLSNVPTGSSPLSCADSLEDSPTPTTCCPT